MTRTLAPFYVHPSRADVWGPFLAGIGTGDIVILNPCSGDIHLAEAQNEMPLWADVCDWVHRRDAAAIIYQPTAWGSTDAGTIGARIRRARDWMPIDGVFYDEAPSWYPWHYALPFSWLRRLHGLARSLRPDNQGLSIWNPGTRASSRFWRLPGFVGVTFEGPTPPPWPQPDANPLRQAAICYCQWQRPGELDWYGYGYHTADPGPGNPFDADMST